MLTRLRFKNFKAWKDSGEIRLAPLTVFFGTNSAGKTSIPQLLLLLKQTAESPDRQRALHLGDARTLVDLGTYEDVVHNHDVSQGLEFDFSWKLELPGLQVEDPLHPSGRYSGDSMGFRAVLRADKRQQPVVESLEYSLRNDDEVVLDVGMRQRDAQGNFSLVSHQYKVVGIPGRPPLRSPLRFYGFPDEAMAYFQNTAFVSDFVLELERMFRSVFYVGPLREYPKRLYLWSGEAPEHVGTRGDRAVEAILAARDRTFEVESPLQHRSFELVVAERLLKMGLIHEFQVQSLGPHRKEYEVLVRTSPRLPEVKLTDVGFGVSQLLPVIVECFYVPRRSIVIFEQPEIHLHPRVQAELADLFVDAIHAREGGIERECQFIIESHSEHFLRRLQRRIAEEKLAAKDAALYFVHTEADGARLEELDVDTFGNIRNWPEGFFGDEMEDLVARTEAQARRMGQGKPK